MSCRKDASDKWNANERSIIDEIKKIWNTGYDALEVYVAIMVKVKEIDSEVNNLLDKLIFAMSLVKLASGAGNQDDPKKKDKISEIKERLRAIFIQVHDFDSKIRGERKRFKKEEELWKKFLYERDQGANELLRMKAEDRRNLLVKNETCFSVMKSGKELIESFQEEWDDIKGDMDQDVLGCMKELVVIAKAP